MLPPLVLQPVVENAVKHGAAACEPETLIKITTYERDGYIYIEVTNSMPNDMAISGDNLRVDMTDSAKNSSKQPKRKSVGLENVRTRLAIQCNGTLDISSSEKETKVTIKLPKSAISIP
jgi:sensor histidine kinase YesM